MYYTASHELGTSIYGTYTGNKNKSKQRNRYITN